MPFRAAAWREFPTAISSIKNEISEDQLKLKRVSDLMAAYEKIVDGNYIDNLIRAQSELGQKYLSKTLCREGTNKACGLAVIVFYRAHLLNQVTDAVKSSAEAYREYNLPSE